MLRVSVLLLAVVCLAGLAQAFRPDFMKVKLAENHKKEAVQRSSTLKAKLAEARHPEARKHPLPEARRQHHQKAQYSYPTTTARPSGSSGDYYDYFDSSFWQYYFGSDYIYDYSDYYYYDSSTRSSYPWGDSTAEGCFEYYQNSYSNAGSGSGRCALAQCQDCYCWRQGSSELYVDSYWGYSYWTYSYYHDNSGYARCLNDVLDSEDVCGCDNWYIEDALQKLKANSSDICEYYGYSSYDYYYSSYGYYSYYNYNSGMDVEPSTCEDCKRLYRDNFYYEEDEDLDHNCNKDAKLQEVEQCFEDMGSSCMDSKIEGFSVKQLLRVTRLQINGCYAQSIFEMCQYSQVFPMYDLNAVTCTYLNEVGQDIEDCVKEAGNRGAFKDACDLGDNMDLVQAAINSTMGAYKSRCDDNEEARRKRVDKCSKCTSGGDSDDDDDDSDSDSDENDDDKRTLKLKMMKKKKDKLKLLKELSHLLGKQ